VGAFAAEAVVDEWVSEEAVVDEWVSEEEEVAEVADFVAAAADFVGAVLVGRTFGPGEEEVVAGQLQSPRR